MTWQLKSEVSSNLILDFNEYNVRLLNDLPISSFISSIITDVNHVQHILSIVKLNYN